MRSSEAYVVYLGMRSVAAFAFALIITYELVYHTVEVGLNPLQLVTVGIVLESTIFLFEIPTGVVADAYSRRLSILIGFCFIGLGFMLEGIVPTFTAVLTAQVLWGIGFTFYSGAGDAWISDEIGTEKAGQAFLRGTQLSQITSLVGIGAGAILVGYGLSLPIIIGASIYLALIPILIWKMGESGFQSATVQPKHILRKMVTPFQEGIQLIRLRSILATILLIYFVIGLYVGGFDRLYAAHLTENFAVPRLGSLDSAAWFSIVSGIAMLFSLVGTEVVRRRLDLTDNGFVARLLFAFYSGLIVCTLIFAFTGWFFLAVACLAISQALRNIGRPLLIAWVNHNTDSNVRATIISMCLQSSALGHVAGSPVIGWIGTAFSLRAALATGALIYAGVLPLLRHAGNYSQQQATEES